MYTCTFFYMFCVMDHFKQSLSHNSLSLFLPFFILLKPMYIPVHMCLPHGCAVYPSVYNVCVNSAVPHSYSQGGFTFLYISFLSHLGERFALRLRTALFHSLMQNDISFFDSHRTGELVNRYSMVQWLGYSMLTMCFPTHTF